MIHIKTLIYKRLDMLIYRKVNTKTDIQNIQYVKGLIYILFIEELIYKKTKALIQK